MKTNEIREKYLEFFQGKGHTVCASDVLVPKWDNTVLFTPAGMNPFKDHFLGKVKLEFTRATSSQKCLRTGDIENVGRTAYHHTFFEMLGNFSFGDYFKREAIVWAWEFLTNKKWMGIDANRLTVSVYLDDDEAADIWHKEIGLSLDRIARLGEHDNFWPAGAPTDGPDGVCGPCSEIFFHPDDAPECEIWNLVFTQFNRSGNPPDNLIPLPSKNIDTGMGLERMAAVMQGVTTNYHIDSLMPIVQAAADTCHVKYDPKSENGRRLRRIADHVRACAMAIHENVYPDRQKENYVIRRLLRRAVLQGHEMGLREPFVYQIVPSVVEMMRVPYPELTTTMDNVMQVIKEEEKGFLKTLETGIEHVERIFDRMKSDGSKTVDGRDAFNLYQEQGIPAELLESIATDRGFGFDWSAYKGAADEHAINSGAGEVGVMGDFGPIDAIKRDVKSTEFIGYTCTSETVSVVGLVSGDELVQELTATKQSQSELLTEPTALAAGNQPNITGTPEPEASACGSGKLTPDKTSQSIVLNRTPFYATSGGQVADTGTITGSNGTFNVTDVEKSGDVLIHHGSMIQGRIQKGDHVTAAVDQNRRHGIERAHTATHILHFALQKFLGEHAQQRGSKVEDDQFRFDFANRQAVSSNDLNQIENEAIALIADGSPVRADIIPMKLAREKGAMMLFGEKYPDPVRMVSIGDYSKELCGGTHVSNTSDVGEFELVSEEATSAGTRRISVLTGAKARQSAEVVRQTLDELSSRLGVTGNPVDSVRSLVDQAKELRKQISSGKTPSSTNATSASTAAVALLDFASQRDCVRQIARGLNVPTTDILSRVESLQAEIADLNQKLTEIENTTTLSADDLLQRVTQVGGIDLVVSEVPGGNANVLRELTDQIRKSNPASAVFLAAIQDTDKVLLVAGLGSAIVKRGISAGNWVKAVAPTVGGGGGGKPDFAQAGGKEPEKINVALDAARQFIVAATAT